MGFTPTETIWFNGKTGGNPNLAPETADTYTVGLVWQPSFLPGANFTSTLPPINDPVLLPLLAKRTFDGSSATFATMSALTGVGAFIASLVMANRASSPALVSRVSPTVSSLPMLSNSAESNDRDPTMG